MLRNNIMKSSSQTPIISEVIDMLYITGKWNQFCLKENNAEPDLQRLKEKKHDNYDGNLQILNLKVLHFKELDVKTMRAL